MDEKTLSVLLGHYSVAFTLDTYTHVLNDHKRQGMNLMEEIFHIDQVLPENMVYPIVVTPAIGGYQMSAPDFPEADIFSATVEEGIQVLAKILRDALVVMQLPPLPSSLPSLCLNNLQFVLQLPLS